MIRIKGTKEHHQGKYTNQGGLTIREPHESGYHQNRNHKESKELHELSELESCHE